MSYCTRATIMLLAAALSSAAAPDADRHKVQTGDPARAAQLVREGATLVADYGLFQILDVTSAGRREAGDPGVIDVDAQNVIELTAGAIDSRSHNAPRRQAAPAVAGGRGLHLVQFAGPVKPEWRAELEATGARIVTYIPHNTYLVYGGADQRSAVKALRQHRPHVQWDGAYLEDDKIQPRARLVGADGLPRTLATDTFAIQLVDDPEENAATLALIDTVRRAPVARQQRTPGYLNVIVRLPPEETLRLAARPDVVSINLYTKPTRLDERQDMIVAGQLAGSVPAGPGYLAWLAGRGFTQAQFTASGFVVDVTDSGLDNGTTAPNHFALYTGGSLAQASRVAYNRLEGTANSGSTLSGCDGHGTLNAHIVGGFVSLTNFPHTDSAGYRHGLGVCPFVRVGSSVIFDPDTFTSPVYDDLISRAYRDGARISANSWGADTAGDYDIDAQNYDALVRDAQPAGAAVAAAGNQPMTIVFAAGNAGSGTQTVGSPGTAKNVITVGAAESVHSHATANGGNNASGNDGCTTPDTEANSAQDIATFSSRGPCSDQRRKPEIVAPGTHITGGVAQQSAVATGLGNDLACFTGEGVCGLPGGGTAGSTNNFFPLGQQFYTTSSGTSHSTPAVAGGCALVYQHFLNLGLNAPSPAMVKAYLVNAARHLTGTGANDTLWSNSQGMGMMNLGTALDGTPRVLRDQLTNDLFTATGQAHLFGVTVAASSQPVRITLAWTDAPGPTSGSAYRNNLDLTVVAMGRTYRGNVFNGSYSTNGGAADARNNLESVFLPAGTTGVLFVTVGAANINSDGVPNFGGSLDQDFALVIANATAGVSNQPPVLDPIGPRSGAVSNVLQFTVRANDPFDGDAIALSASNLPAWATFATVTNAGSVTNIFTGTPDTTGVFAVTFRATDKDGAASEPVTLTIGDGSSCGVILSEYVEGSSNNKALEIYNGTGAALDLAASNYIVQIYYNGSTTTGDTIALSGTVPAGGAFVITHASAGAALLAYADQTSAKLQFNGDDAVVLRRGGTAGTVVDALGVIGTDPGTEWGSGLTSTADNTLRRKSAVTAGDTNPSDAFSPATEWDGFAADTYDGLGVHVMSCSGAAGTPPALDPIANPSVTLGDTLTFAVTAQPTEGDEVTLTAGNLPTGAAFSAVGENGTFTWTNAGPVGVYTASFHAADNDGATSRTATLTVQAAPVISTNALALYTFDDASSNFTRAAYQTAAGISAGLMGSADGTVTNFTGSPARAIADTGFTGTSNNHFAFTLTVATGSTLSVSGLRFSDQRSNTGPTQWGLRHGGDGYAADLGAGGAHLAFASNEVPLSITGLSGSVTFRLVGRNASSAGGTWRLDNVAVLGTVESLTPPPDSDGDGMLDAWEQANFGSLTNAGSATDFDGDLMLDLHEFLAGTVPTNPASLLVVNAVAGSDDAGTIVRWQSASNRTYVLETAYGLPDVFTGVASNLASTPPDNTYTDAVSTNVLQFYRIRLQP